MEAISEVEMNAIERAVHVAERDRKHVVEIPVRCARLLISPTSDDSDEVDDVDELREEVVDALKPADSAVRLLRGYIGAAGEQLVCDIENALQKAVSL